MKSFPLDRYIFKLDFSAAIVVFLGLILISLQASFGANLIVIGFSELALGSILKVAIIPKESTKYESFYQKLVYCSAAIGCTSTLFTVLKWPMYDKFCLQFYAALLIVLIFYIWKQPPIKKIISRLEIYKICGCLFLCILLS